MTRHLIKEQQLTALMVTHNMRQALQLGNRLIMLHGGRVIFDVRDEEKAAMTVDNLLEAILQSSGGGVCLGPDAAGLKDSPCKFYDCHYS